MNAILMIGEWVTAALLTGQLANSVPSDKPEVATVRLEEIWAYEMPGTRPMMAAEVNPTEVSATELRLVDELLDAIDPKPQKETKPGFAVAGSDVEALRAAHDVLVHKKTVESLSTEQDIWIAFFSHNFGRYVHIQGVELGGKKIVIRFQFIPHMTKEMTQHFALIPLGKLARGTYQVQIVQAPMPKKFFDWVIPPVDPASEARVVCRPFEFEVAEGSSGR
jgi:hypothetical protein